MVNENKNKKIINMIIIIIIIVIVIVIGIFLYKSIQQKINNDRFIKYIENSNYHQGKNGIYTKTINGNNEQITYKVIFDQYLLTKEKSKSLSTEYISTITNYKQDGTIEIIYKLEGYNSEGIVGTIYQKGTYKNGKFTCQIITNSNFETKCQEMKKEAQDFEQEINKIFEDNNINVKYVTLKDKNAV